MRVAGAHDKIARDVVVFAGLKSVDVTRRDVQRSEHDRHGGGEIFAMSRALLEQEVGQRIGLRRPAEVQRVAVVRAQIALNGARFVIGSLCRAR